MHVCHTCDNPPCCNPTHLFIGTNADNMADKVRKGRQSHHGKLNWTRAAAIRGDLRHVQTIANAYGISTRTVYRIRAGQAWSPA
jgi:hypothetical protein